MSECTFKQLWNLHTECQHMLITLSLIILSRKKICVCAYVIWVWIFANCLVLLVKLQGKLQPWQQFYDHYCAGLTPWAIRTLTQGHVMQGDLCTYMLQESKVNEDTARRSKQVAIARPATLKTLCHGIPIVNIQSIYDGTIVSVREDGFICCWSPTLKPLKTKHMFVCINVHIWWFLLWVSCC